MWPLLGVGSGAGGDGAGIWCNRYIWVLDGSGAGDAALCNIFLAYGCGRRAGGSILGLGLVVGAGLDQSCWSVGLSLSRW